MKKILFFLLIVMLSSCSKGFELTAPKTYGKIDLRDAIQISSGAVSATMNPELKEVGTIKVDKISLVNDKPLLNIERQEFVLFKNYPKGKVTRTYKKRDSNLTITEVEVIEPIEDKNNNSIQLAVSTISGTAGGGILSVIIFGVMFLYKKWKVKK